jgi:hypothetical protein
MPHTILGVSRVSYCDVFRPARRQSNIALQIMDHPQQHTTSYYAASANDQTEYPRLEGRVEADVCVVGAGFTGISSAIFLAERGYNVCVVEASRVGFGASGRNGGQMIAGISGEDRIRRHHGPAVEKLLWEMRWAGHRIIRERVEKYGIECDLKAGYLDVAIKPRHVRDLEADFERLTRFGFAKEFLILDRGETCATIGTMARRSSSRTGGWRRSCRWPMPATASSWRSATGCWCRVSSTCR